MSTTAGASTRVRGALPRPTRVVVVALVVLAAATVLFHLPTAAVWAIALGLVGVFCVDALAIRTAVVSFEVSAPTAMARGTAVPFEVRATSAARVHRLRQPVPAGLSLGDPDVHGSVISTEVTGSHRGSHVVTGAVARVIGPLALATFDRRCEDRTWVRVLPDLPRARWLALRRRGAASAEGTAIRRVGIGTEFDSVRDYDPNDDVRFVNWMATSRCGRPMTNQYRVDENRDLVCLVDAGRLMCAPVASMTRLDAALDALCVLAAAADEAGDRVGATAFTTSVVRHVAPRRRGAAAVVEALYDLEPVEIESDFSLAFQRVAVRKRSIVVVFTDLVDPAAARQLLDAVPILARRHEVLVVSCVDDGLAAVAATPVHAYSDAVRSSVALGLLDAHRDAVRRATTLGAHVVEAAPDKLGAASVTAYARLKARARV